MSGTFMIFDALPRITISWESFRNLWMLLPVLPLAGVVLSLAAQYFLPKNADTIVFYSTVLLQIALGVVILVSGGQFAMDTREIPVSVWDYPIVFRIDTVKLSYLAVLMVPLIAALPKYGHLRNPFLRVVFLFYLAGCSGMVVTGDLFNLFVFYELMIMAAYVLVTIGDDFGASIKYMIFGSLSSVALLGGIVVLYAGGASFSMQPQAIADVPAANLWWAMVLFTVAFCIKSAFVPIALAPCHAAAGSLVSGFLAAFTIFTGLMGLHLLVLEPAALIGADEFFVLIRILSAISILVSSVILFWEPVYNRAVAAGTIVAVGMAGLLLSYRAVDYALAYILVHALYKTLLFLLGDDLQQDGMTIRAAGRPALAMLAIGVFFAAGLYPALPAMAKAALPDEASRFLQATLALPVFLVVGGFVKFRYRLAADAAAATGGRGGMKGSPAAYGIVLVLGFVFYGLLGVPAVDTATWLPELAMLLLASLLGRRLFNALPQCVGLDRTWIYGGLNRQLLYILVLLCAVIGWLAMP